MFFFEWAKNWAKQDNVLIIKKDINKKIGLLCAVLVLALSIRIWGVAYDLPFIYHPDEPKYIMISQNIFKANNLQGLDPHFYNYPSLFFYINAFAYTPYYLVGKLFGVFLTRSDILAPIQLLGGVAQSSMPTTVLLGRIVTIIFGVGTVGVTFVIGKQLSDKVIVGLLASLMVAISPTNVSLSRFITPDTFVTFFATLSFLAIVLVYKQGKTWHYVMAGLCAGLTISSKYNGALIVFPLLLAHLLRYGKTALKDRNIYIALFLCGFGFLVTTPAAIFNFSAVLSDISFESHHYATGHTGMDGNTTQFYLNYMWETAGIIYIVAALEILRGFYFRNKETILLSCFPVIYFVFINTFMVRNDRTLLPLTPFLYLLAASFLVFLLNKAIRLPSQGLRRLYTTIVICFVIISLVLPMSTTITNTIRLTTVNSRETARIWINHNLPSGSKIAIEGYSPFIDPTKFSVKGVGTMIRHNLAWYSRQGFDYLVFSEGMSKRFYLEPERYKGEISRYKKLFRQLQLVKLFNDGDYEVRVYKIK